MKTICHKLLYITLALATYLTPLSGQSCFDGSYSFADDIAPILTVRCGGCHGSVGGFSVATYASVLAGGSNCGPGVTPGNATDFASSLIDKLQWAVNGPDAACGSNMPQNQSPITAAQYIAIETWIAAGAQEFCPTAPCPPDHTFNGNGGLTGTETGTVLYDTEGAIESTQIIAATAVVSYDSKISVSLLEGFQTIGGAEFHAYIDGCL